MIRMADAPRYERRAFLILVGTGSLGYIAWARRAGKTSPNRPPHVNIAQFDDAGHFIRSAELASVQKTESEWRQILPADSYCVTRRRDTELAGTGRYDHFYDDGIYRCICCDTALFSSAAKYASGTGWPSFTEPIAKENVVESLSATFGIRETEVACARCAAHLGHVFDDGPPPKNLRYCINSVALKFRPANR